MSYREWCSWFRSLKNDLKWFVLLILFRPVIDTTSQITIFFVSPLQIVGVLILVLITVFLFFKKTRASRDRYVVPQIDISLKRFGLILLVNMVFLCIMHANLMNLGNALKLILPFYLYLYLKNRVKTENDLNGILQAVLYSSIVTFSFLLYEALFGAINPQLYKKVQLYKGLYADSFNYSIMFFVTFSISVYFYILHLRKSNRFGLLVAIIFCLGLLVLAKIHHNLSNATFGVVVIYNMLAILRYKNNILIRVGLCIGAIVVGFIFYDYIIHGFHETFGTEMAVLSGDANVTSAFHGRMFRWFKYFRVWDNLGTFFMLFGTPLSGHPLSGNMISGGMHSDYVRILFATGFFGLSFYLFFLVKSFFLKQNGEFALLVLRRNLLIIMALFSITSMPIDYQSMMYVVMTVTAYGQKKNLEAKIKKFI